MNGLIKSLGRSAIALAIASAALVAVVPAASAAPAMATGNVNVRMGPGVNFVSVDTLRYGDVVDIRQCKNGWCFVRHSGSDGWVSQKYLAHAVNKRYAPRNDVGVSIGIDGFYLGFGGRPHHGHWGGKHHGGKHHGNNHHGGNHHGGKHHGKSKDVPFQKQGGNNSQWQKL